MGLLPVAVRFSTEVGNAAGEVTLFGYAAAIVVNGARRRNALKVSPRLCTLFELHLGR